MTLNPRIFTNAGSLYLEWDADPDADGYRMTAPDGSIHQVGRNQTIVKLGQPAQPFTVAVASDYPAAAETLTYPDTPAPLTVTQSIAEGSQITAAVDWTATPNNPVTEVDFYIDAALKQIDVTPPYSYRLDPAALTDGPHTFTVRALDPTGKTATSDVTASTKKPVPPPPGVLPRYGGATGHVIQKDGCTTATINAELDKWADIGCQILRVDLLQSSTYLARFHTILAGCQQRGMKLWATLRGTSGPYGAATAGAYAKAMATEFGTSLAGYGYVNEPNLGSPTIRYQPEAMGPEMAAVYAAIKSVDSKILVGTCEMGWDSVGDYSQWWPRVYNSGGKDHFDIFIAHCYGMPNSAPWTEALSTHAQYGQGKPIFVTEAGTGQVSAQATVIPAALKDTRVQSVCIYNMNLEVPGYNMWQGSVANSPGYTSYKNTPKT